MLNVLKEKFKSKLIAQGVQPPRKESATVLFKANIRLLRVINTHDGFLTIIQNNKQAKKIFSNDSKEKQNFLGFTLVLPLKMRARLTLVLKRLERQVITEDSENIKQEITTASPNSMVEDIFIMKKKCITKIRFLIHTAAKVIKENGIYLSKLYIAP